MQRLSTILVFILGTFPLLQSQSISGSVTDSDGAALSYANVLLLAASDSTLVKGAVTDDAGSFTFSGIPQGTYVVSIRMVGFPTVYSDAIELTGNSAVPLEPFVLTEGLALDEVQVLARKPLYEQKIDRMVINVGTSIVAAGSTALEILQRSPGVVVNRQTNSISMVNKEGVVVMINGKVTYMPIAGVIQLLAGMSADNIESIELITTPPSNLDAEGNAGFINIVLKANPDVGLNGNYAFAFGVGNGTTTNDNISFNYRKGGFNLYGNYAFVRLDQNESLESGRVLFGDPERAHFTFSQRMPVQRNHQSRIGADFNLSDQTVLGVLVSAYDNKWTMRAYNASVQEEDGEMTSLTAISNVERNQWQHYGGNINLRHALNASDYFSIDADFLHYADENPNDYQYSFYDGPEQFFLYTQFTRSDKYTPIDIGVGKVDFHKKLSDAVALDLGGKTAVSRLDNTVLVEEKVGDSWIREEEYSNTGDLNEKIYAGYVSMDYQLNEKTSFKGGLRYEYTDSRLNTAKEGRVVDRQFGKVFPSVYLGHQFSETFGINASYAKRITRPTFNDMAPFVIFIDPSTFFAGNTGLQPAVSNTAKIDLRFHSALLSLQYSVEDSSIASFQERIDAEANRLFYEPVNLKKTQTYALTFGMPVQVTSWCELRANVNLANIDIAGYSNAQLVEVSQFVYNGNLTATGTFSHGWGAEISANYFGPSYYGLSYYKETYLITVGLQKDFGEKWGSLRFTVNDLLNSFYWSNDTDYPTQGGRATGKWDFSNRTFGLTYSRSFGNKKLRATRNRTLGAEEERQRVN